jgi:hypothetical protein
MAEINQNLWDRAANTWRRLVDTATVVWDTSTPGVASASVPDGAVTNAKLADMAQSTIKGRAAGAGTGDPTDLSAAQVRDILGIPAAGRTLLASGNLNSGTTLSIAGIPETFAYIVLQLFNISHDNAANRQPLVRVSTDNGSSFDATAANYQASNLSTSSTTVNDHNAASLIEGSQQAAAATWNITVAIGPYQTGILPMWQACVVPSGGDIRIIHGCYIANAANIDALQVLLDGAGNFDGSGSYSLYGIA